MTTIARALILSALVSGCQSLPEGQSAYGTTAVTRWLHPESYQAMVDEGDVSKQDALANRFGTQAYPMKPVIK